MCHYLIILFNLQKRQIKDAIGSNKVSSSMKSKPLS